MKRFLSLLLVVAMIVSLGVCCIPASAEKADNSLGSFDLAKIVADYGKYLNADTIKAIIGAFNEIKENGISFDKDTVALLVSAISGYIGDGNTVDPAVVKAVVAGVSDAVSNGIDVDATTITAILAGIGEKLLGNVEIDPSFISGILDAVNKVKDSGISLDFSSIKNAVAGLVGGLGEGISIDPAMISAVMSAAGSLFSKGISINPDVITSVLVAVDKALPVDTSVVNAIITGLTGNGYTIPALNTSELTILINCIADKALEGVKIEAPTITALVKAFSDFQAGGGKLSEQVIGDVVKVIVGNETYAECMTIICKVTGMYPFSDIANSGYCDAICEAHFLDIVKGYDNGTFRPNQAVTRAQFITMLWRAAGEPSASGTLTFKDNGYIANSYKEAVIWGVTRGVIKGYGDGTFRPNQNISRAQMATFVYRYLKNVQFYDFDAVLPALVFSDSGKIATPYVDAVKAIVSTGIMNGTSLTTFDPNGTANRGMAATVILRTYKLCELTHA